jgi:hypothetical protein
MKRQGKKNKERHCVHAEQHAARITLRLSGRPNDKSLQVLAHRASAAWIFCRVERALVCRLKEQAQEIHQLTVIVKVAVADVLAASLPAPVTVNV